MTDWAPPSCRSVFCSRLLRGDNHGADVKLVPWYRFERIGKFSNAQAILPIVQERNASPSRAVSVVRFACRRTGDEFTDLCVGIIGLREQLDGTCGRPRPERAT